MPYYPIFNPNDPFNPDVSDYPLPPDWNPGDPFPSGPGPGGSGAPPPTGGSPPPTDGTVSPWPAWATAIDPGLRAWRTLDNGELLHKSTDRVYSSTGTFLATLQDYLAGIRDEAPQDPNGPPAGGTTGQRWTDPATGDEWQYYEYLGWMKNTEDPKNPNELGPVEEGGFGPPGTLPPGSPDPGDGPITRPRAPRVTDYIGLPPPTNPGGTGPRNTMPDMPINGMAGTQPYLDISSASGTPVGPPEAFKPYGSPQGYLSQALRYGGPPSQTQQGGYSGTSNVQAIMAAAQAAALRG